MENEPSVSPTNKPRTAWGSRAHTQAPCCKQAASCYSAVVQLLCGLPKLLSPGCHVTIRQPACPLHPQPASGGSSLTKATCKQHSRSQECKPSVTMETSHTPVRGRASSMWPVSCGMTLPHQIAHVRNVPQSWILCPPDPAPLIAQKASITPDIPPPATPYNAPATILCCGIYLWGRCCQLLHSAATVKQHCEATLK